MITSLNIPDNVFNLTEDQVEMSKQIYQGKIIKCLVAPYHTHAELEKVLKHTKYTYLFPERDMTYEQTRYFIALIVDRIPADQEVVIVTASQSIIMDMLGQCVHVLAKDGEIYPSSCDTFIANIHDIRHKVLENERFEGKDEQRALHHTLS